MQEKKTVVVPVAFDQHTEKLVDFARYIAGKLSAEVHFFHVCEAYAGYGDFEHPMTEEIEMGLRKHAEEKMESLLAAQGKSGPLCSGKVVSGDTVDEIVAYAQQVRAELIVIATHGARGLEKILLGSVAERVLKKAPCPTLTFNPFR